MGVQVNALVDTGASVSCIHRLLCPRSVPLSTSHIGQLRGANNSLLQVAGRTKFEFYMDGRSFQHEFFVISELSQQLILGLDFLTRHRVSLDCATKRVIFPPVLSVVFDLHSASLSSGDVHESLGVKFPSLHQFQSGAAKVPPVVIKIGSVPPIKQPMQRRAVVEKEVIKKEVDDMLRLGVVRPSHSPWCSPVHLVKKKDGTLRFCIDFRRLNAFIEDDAFPLPNISAVVDALHGSQVFSTLDLAKGYWQIPLSEDSKPLTAFATDEGLFEFNVLPFGLCTAPAIFQRVMSNCVRDLPFVRVYLDDIIVFSPDISTHQRHLRSLFERLARYGLRLNVKKCCFNKSDIQFLGFTVTSHGIKLNDDKVSAIIKLSPPTDVKRLQEFLGLVNFYRAYCPNLAEVSVPLYELLQKRVPFVWGPRQVEAFDLIKELLTSPPLLRIADPHQPFIVSTDASAYALGCVLSQMVGGVEHPIAFASRTLNTAEKNYSVIEKELLAIVFAVKRFRCYLYGQTFTIYTDHNPLQYASTLKDSYGRIARWTLFLQDFRFQVQYRRGVANGNADALSRCPSIHSLQLHDEFFSAIQKDGCQAAMGPYRRHKDNLSVSHGEVWIKWDGTRKRVIAPADRSVMISNIHGLGHFGVKKTVALISQVAWWPGIYRDVRTFISCCFPCQRRKPSSVTPSKSSLSLQTMFPLDCVAWDIMGSISPSASGHKYILLIVDLFSRWTVAVPLHETSSDTLAEALWTHYFSRYGPPLRIHSDQGPNLSALVLKKLFLLWGVQQSTTVAYYPQGNGVVERLNAVLQTVIAKKGMDASPNQWDRFISAAVYAHNVTPHATTKCSPHSLFFGREPRIPGIDIPCQDDGSIINRRFILIRKLLQTLSVDAECRWEDGFHVGDLVLIHRPPSTGVPKKFHLPWQGPYRIVERLSEVNFRVTREGARDLVVNRKQMKAYIQETTTCQEICVSMGCLDIKCYRCQKYGHFFYECPQKGCNQPCGTGGCGEGEYVGRVKDVTCFSYGVSRAGDNTCNQGNRNGQFVRSRGAGGGLVFKPRRGRNVGKAG